MRTYQIQIRVKVIVMKYRKNSPLGVKKKTQENMLSFGIGLRTSRQQAIGKNKNEANVLYFSMKMNSRRKSRRTQTSLLQQLTLGRSVKGCKFTDLLPVIYTFLVSVILTNSHIFIYSCIRIF